MNPDDAPAPPRGLLRIFLAVAAVHVLAVVVILFRPADRNQPAPPRPEPPEPAQWFSPRAFVGERLGAAPAGVRAVVRPPGDTPPPASGRHGADDWNRELGRLIEKLWRAPAIHPPPSQPGRLLVAAEPGGGLSCRIDRSSGHVGFDHDVTSLVEDLSARSLPLPVGWPEARHEVLVEVRPR